MVSYLELKGKAAELKQTRLELVTAIKADGRAIKDGLTLLNVEPVDKIDADTVLFHAQRLKSQKDRLSQLDKELAAIKAELGEE